MEKWHFITAISASLFSSWQKCGIVERICYVCISHHSQVVSFVLIYIVGLRSWHTWGILHATGVSNTMRSKIDIGRERKVSWVFFIRRREIVSCAARHLGPSTIMICELSTLMCSKTNEIWILHYYYIYYTQAAHRESKSIVDSVRLKCYSWVSEFLWLNYNYGHYFTGHACRFQITLWYPNTAVPINIL